MKNEMDQVIQRTQRYWYVDGLTEIAAGLIISLLSLFYLALLLLPNGSTAAWLVGIGQPVILVLSGWLSSKAVRALKERITYPRTGYVAYSAKRKRFKRAFLAAILSVLVAATFTVGITLLKLDKSLIPVFVGVFLALAIALIGYRFGLFRFYALAAYIFLVGFLTSWLPLIELEQNAFLFGLFGLGWIVSGVLTLRHYLSHTQPANGEEL